VKPSSSSQLNGIRRGAPAKAELRGEMVTNPQPRGLYDAIVATAFDSYKPAKTVAEGADLTYPRLTDLANDSRRVHLKLFEAVALVRASGNPAIADWFDAQLGRVGFTLPQLPPHADEMQRELARSVMKFGEFLRENGDALADGRLEPHEVGPILKTIDQMIAGLCEYRELVKAKADHDRPMAVGQ
jgi:hypothetical protein